ncbi:hypothetical protein Z946_3425 [Sulfitobacter noctilucicola]|uniref:Uncharacterized protein n=1 Tax=Sulfitobacter noctilucicola TaxID=1342301 RepID=A0A7W6M8B5_9RHOB|nr:hypothetical protein [Sulfitobacter noctilucicola]KIN64533.1 hypothetical protein Z946_3425 [Sulfitobacter noctilucicola]MBB4174311.1 hypothetical protein [Sulfitobacter noctilucicola]
MADHDNETDQGKDRRPEVARDDNPKSPKGAQEKWHNAEATLGEAPASDPNAQKRGRVSDG